MMGPIGRLLWTWKWTFGFHNRLSLKKKTFIHWYHIECKHSFLSELWGKHTSSDC
jgi:hypothetical protein